MEVVPDRSFPGQYYDAETWHNYNYFRDYDPSVGRYIESDPIGLSGGVNTYTYVMNNPMSNKDPRGLECIQGVGCWTTPAEGALVNSGQYSQYYALACADGDAYACFAGNVAANDSWWGHRATNRLLDKLQEEAKNKHQCLDEQGIMERIRKELAEAYANYLPNSPDQARWPMAEDIAQIHWSVFAQFACRVRGRTCATT